MNKYLKILALSGGVLSSIAPTAIKVGNKPNNDINSVYQNVEKIQNILPKLSRINYRLDINGLQDENVKFSTINEDGNDVDLSKDETINYLSETLNQVNLEYEQLREYLSNAIKDSMDYLDKYKSGEIELTNEQKIYIKEHSNSIKYLAETLEDLNEDIICIIDGCEDCEDCDFDETANRYISSIKDLETRIDALQNSINSLQLITNISNPYFYAGYSYTPNNVVYGFKYSKFKAPNIEDSDSNNANITNDNNEDISKDNINQDNSHESTDIVKDNSDNIIDTTQEDNSSNIANDTLDNTAEQNTVIENNSNTEELEESDNTSNTETNQGSKEIKPTTFGLKSNIDTYAPTKRNIDTFFNTALYDNEYGYGGGYGMPYGYGMQYGGGYAMPYGGYGNPYMNGYNSNLINREAIKKSDNTPVNANLNTTPNIEDDSNIETENKTSKPKKIRAKRAKNIDTYTGTTVQSNINSMGESKLSSFLKEKITNIRNKIRNKKKSQPNKDIENFEDKIDETVIEETNIKNVDTYKDETENVNADTNNSVDSADDTSKTTNNITSNNEQPELHSEQPIIAQ